MIVVRRSHSDEGTFALYAFHGWIGSKYFSTKKGCWLGFTAMKSYQNRGEVPMVEACGPVQTAEGADHHVGAVRATNNTAEMQALIEALFWLNSCVKQDVLPFSSKVMITVGSLYVQELIDEKFVARENRALARAALSHVESDSEKAATSHTLGTGDTLVTWEILLLLSWQS